jgi:hypothetical protein
MKGGEKDEQRSNQEINSRKDVGIQPTVREVTGRQTQADKVYVLPRIWDGIASRTNK